MRTRASQYVYLFILFSPAFGRGGGGGRGGGYGSSRGTGGGHSYPHSTGYSGTGSGGSHTYPHSTGLSGHGTNYNRPTVTKHYETHHHYHYNPPQQVHYPGYGSTSHPVYHGQPPVYVYSYRDSGSRFDTLLTGLALYNLGRMSSSHHHYDNDRNYRSNPGETCKLGIRKENGDYEETRVECRIMTSFILDAQTEQAPVSTNHVSTTVTNTTIVNGASNQSVSVTVVSDALEIKGPSIPVTPGMQCYMIHVTYYSTKKNTVPCGLLKAYAESSMRRNGAARNGAFMEIIFAVILCALTMDRHLNLF